MAIGDLLMRGSLTCDKCSRSQSFLSIDENGIRERAYKVGWRFTFGYGDLCPRCVDDDLWRRWFSRPKKHENRLTDSDVEAYLTCKCTRRELAELYHVSYLVMGNWLRRKGIETSLRPNQLTDQDIDDYRWRRMNRKNLADKYGVTSTLMQRWIDEKQIVREKVYRPRDSHRADAIVKFIKSGKTIREVADMFDLTWQRVQQIFRAKEPDFAFVRRERLVKAPPLSADDIASYRRCEVSSGTLAKKYGVQLFTMQNWLRRINVPLNHLNRSVITIHRDLEIHERFHKGGVRILDLAKEYGISFSVCWQIVHDWRGRVSKIKEKLKRMSA